MNKIILSEEDISNLYKFRDSNKDLVRNFPVPFNEICLESKEYPTQIKVYYKNDIFKLYYKFSGKNLGYIEFKKHKNNLIIIKDKMDKLINEENKQSFISIYCSLMSYIATIPKTVCESKNTFDEKNKNDVKNNKKISVKNNIITISSFVYPLKENKRKYASPTHSFLVRGHYRTYKSGKKIWIQGFKKNINQKSQSNKIYNLKIEKKD